MNRFIRFTAKYQILHPIFRLMSCFYTHLSLFLFQKNVTNILCHRNISSSSFRLWSMEFINRISIIRQITKCFFYLDNSILKINAIPCQSKDFTHTHACSKCNNNNRICLTTFGCFKKNINFLIT